MNLPVDYTALTQFQRKVVREEYVRLQQGICHHCRKDLNGRPAAKVAAKKVDKTLFPDGFFNYPVHLHHSHVSGTTIGAVHAYCNAVLWQYHGE